MLIAGGHNGAAARRVLLSYSTLSLSTVPGVLGLSPFILGDTANNGRGAGNEQ